MLKPILGEDYFKKFAAQKPRAFDSYVQQYDRLTNGQDKIIMGAQYSGAVEFQAKGAPIGFVFPEKGLPAVSETYGIVAEGPHPNAAKLFIGWLLEPAQQVTTGTWSPRRDVEPPAGYKPILSYQVVNDYRDFLTNEAQLVELRKKFEGYTGPVVNAGGVR